MSSFLKIKIFVILFAFLITVSCKSGSSKNGSNNAEVIVHPKAKVYRVSVIKELEHSDKAYTQGLFFYKGKMYESSGQYGESYFAQINPENGAKIRSFKLDGKYFGEGAVVLNDKLYILTWQEHAVLVYDIDKFTHLSTFDNPRAEGWGLTTDGKSLIMSDGSGNLFFMDPSSFKEMRKISVSLNGRPISLLNELEYIDGEIWANVYQEDAILIINPETGVVRAVIECTNLLSQDDRTSRTDVLNGIAYNPETRSIYVTGKYWPKMYMIENPGK